MLPNADTTGFKSSVLRWIMLLWLILHLLQHFCNHTQDTAQNHLQTRFLIPVWTRISHSNFVVSIALTLTETDTTTTEVRHVTGHEDRGKAGQNPKIDEAPRLSDQILMNYQDFLLLAALTCWDASRDVGHLHVHLYHILERTLVVGILKPLFSRGCWAACDRQGGMCTRVNEPQVSESDTQVGHNQEGEHCLSSKEGSEEGNKSLKSQNRQKQKITQGYKRALNPEGNHFKTLEIQGQMRGDYYLHLVWFPGKIGGRSAGLISLIKIGQMQMSN